MLKQSFNLVPGIVDFLWDFTYNIHISFVVPGKNTSIFSINVVSTYPIKTRQLR